MSQQHMTQNVIRTPAWKRAKIGLLGAVVLAFFIVFGFWSGVPAGERALPFWIGVAVLFVMLSAFSLTAWHLMVRPLPAGQTVLVQPIRVTFRQALALLLSVGQYGFIVGAFWDEVWHRQYGIPFGDDFFWRPHLLMYFGIAVTVLLAFAGLYTLIRGGQGTFQQRFRANPVIGLLVLAGGFLLYVLPADPIWHAIYGEDLTAWSIPHLLLLVSLVSILLLVTAIHMTALSRREWGTPGQLRLSAALPLLMFAAISLIWNQFFITEWDSGVRFVLARPEWLLPVLIASGAAFIGVMANHTLRVFGAATISGILALALRFALIQLFDAENIMQVNSWVLALPSLVLVDLWYVFHRGAWIGAGVAAALGMWLAVMAVFNRFFPLYPITNLPVAFVMLMVASLGMSRLGAAFGDYLAEGNQQIEEAPAGTRLPLVSLGVAAATVVFIVFFVTTATPPR